MAKRKPKVEDQLEALSRLRSVPPAEAMPALRSALAHPVNVMVAKAARIAADRQFSELIPALLESFYRLFDNPNVTDPQCWGKNAIAAALRDLDHHESAPFLKGAAHVQMEPVWGTSVDTAPPLRSTCALAVPACSDVRRAEVLRVLVDLLADPFDKVRADSIRGLEAMDGDEPALVLRLKATLGDDEPHVIGQALESLLRLEGAGAVPFAARFLHRGPENCREEAALALGASRVPAALPVLEQEWKRMRGSPLRDTILRAIGASRQSAAVEILIEILKHCKQRDVPLVREALDPYCASDEIRRRVELARKDEPPPT